MSQVDRVVMKYSEAADKFEIMQNAISELSASVKDINSKTESIVGSGWVGSDAQSYNQSMSVYTNKLDQQSQGMGEVVTLLRRQANEMYQKELDDARRADALTL